MFLEKKIHLFFFFFLKCAFSNGEKNSCLTFCNFSSSTDISEKISILVSQFCNQQLENCVLVKISNELCQRDMASCANYLNCKAFDFSIKNAIKIMAHLYIYQSSTVNKVK